MMHDYSLRSGGTRTSKQDGGGGSNFTSASSGSGLPGTTIYDISHTETEKHPLGFLSERNHRCGAQQENVLKIGRLMP